MTTTATTSLTKLEIIEAHLLTSIQMIALGQESISTHVVVMACEELVLSLAKARNIFLDFDYRIYVKDEFHKDYRQQVRRAYNFFKHADKDPEAPYDGPSDKELRSLNEIVTLMNSRGYQSLGGTRLNPIVNIFAIVMMVTTPDLFKSEWMDSYPQLRQQFSEARSQPKYAKVALREQLFREGLLPEIPYRGSTLD